MRSSLRRVFLFSAFLIVFSSAVITANAGSSLALEERRQAVLRYDCQLSVYEMHMLTEQFNNAARKALLSKDSQIETEISAIKELLLELKPQSDFVLERIVSVKQAVYNDGLAHIIDDKDSDENRKNGDWCLNFNTGLHAQQLIVRMKSLFKKIEVTTTGRNFAY